MVGISGGMQWVTNRRICVVISPKAGESGTIMWLAAQLISNWAYFGLASIVILYQISVPRKVDGFFGHTNNPWWGRIQGTTKTEEDQLLRRRWSKFCQKNKAGPINSRGQWLHIREWSRPATALRPQGWWLRLILSPHPHIEQSQSPVPSSNRPQWQKR